MSGKKRKKATKPGGAPARPRPAGWGDRPLTAPGRAASTRSADLLAAKQAVAGRLLRAGLRGGVMGMRAPLSVAAAVASAPRNVHAVGVGHKLVEGAETATRCVRIYVLKKLAPSLIPPKDLLPTSIDGFPTDVIESPPAFIGAPPACTHKRRQRQDPKVGGISAAHQAVTAGTIACFCRSTRAGDAAGDLFALSNNHVFANVNQAQVGDDLWQPGPADGGTAADHFADLHRFVPLVLGGTAANRVDAAIGRLRPGVQALPQVCAIGAVTGTREAAEGLKVRKHGRTTGYTEGEVSDVAYDALIGMSHVDPSILALFENQVRIEARAPFPAIGLGGDSGSLVVARDEPRAVGLYFAGPPGGEYGVANPIAAVLEQLEIRLL